MSRRISLNQHLTEQLDSFLAYLKVTRSRSENTARNGRSIIHRFIGFIASQPEITTLDQITLPLVIAFLGQFQAPSYRSNAIYYLRQFFDFLKHPANPARQIAMPRINQSAGIKFLEKDELIQLLELLEQKVSSGRHIRERALLLLILFTGIRADEALSLHKEDLLATGNLRIRDSKTHESRLAHVPVVGMEAIATYHQAFPCPDNPYVFYPERDPGQRPVAYTTTRLLVKSLFRQAGITGKGKNLHALRHTFARILVKARFRQEEIQKLLGHKNIRTTDIYTQLCENDLSETTWRVQEAVTKYMEE